jgi:hypothetical protein
MPLSVAVIPLELQKADGERDGASPDTIINTLASDIATAVNAYVTQAIVNVTIVNTAVIGASAVGPVVGTGIGVGTGVLL